jgi:hypothetical protein
MMELIGILAARLLNLDESHFCRFFIQKELQHLVRRGEL